MYGTKLQSYGKVLYCEKLLRYVIHLWLNTCESYQLEHDGVDYLLNYLHLPTTGTHHQAGFNYMYWVSCVFIFFLFWY